MPGAGPDHQPPHHPVPVFWVSAVYSPPLPQDLAVQANQSSDKRLQRDDKLEAPMLRDVQGPLQVPNLPGQPKVLYRRHPKA